MDVQRFSDSESLNSFTSHPKSSTDSFARCPKRNATPLTGQAEQWFVAPVGTEWYGEMLGNQLVFKSTISLSNDMSWLKYLLELKFCPIKLKTKYLQDSRIVWGQLAFCEMYWHKVQKVFFHEEMLTCAVSLVFCLCHAKGVLLKPLKTFIYRWRFQPIPPKIVKLDHSPGVGVKIKKWNHHVVIFSGFTASVFKDLVLATRKQLRYF